MKTALIISLFILSIGLAGLFVVVSQKNQTLTQEMSETEQLLNRLPQTVEVPVFVGKSKDKQAIATLSATALLIEDRATDAVLYQKAADSKRYPASTAKLMTALVARKIYSMDQVFTVREEAFTEGTRMDLQVGEKMTVRDLLAGLLISSGNDAAFVLANNALGGYENFVKNMNEEAQRLELQHTVFSNASGLDNDQQQSSASDLYILANKVLADPFLADIVATKEVTVKDVDGRFSHPLVNRNQLLHTVPGVFGVKTGTTDSAGENLITAIRKNGRETIVVMLGSQARYPETLELLQWLDKNYQWEVRSVETL